VVAAFRGSRARAARRLGLHGDLMGAMGSAIEGWLAFAD
jgi:hypothetical protein